MPRMLKTLFPCKECGATTQVKTLKEGPDALCDWCKSLVRFRRLAMWSRDRAVIQAENFFEDDAKNPELGNVQRAAKFWPIVESLTSACKYGLLTSERELNERRRLIWVKWSMEIIARIEKRCAQVRDLVKDDGSVRVLARKRGFEVIDGGCEKKA